MIIFLRYYFFILYKTAEINKKLNISKYLCKYKFYICGKKYILNLLIKYKLINLIIYKSLRHISYI